MQTDGCSAQLWQRWAWTLPRRETAKEGTEWSETLARAFPCLFSVCQSDALQNPGHMLLSCLKDKLNLRMSLAPVTCTRQKEVQAFSELLSCYHPTKYIWGLVCKCVSHKGISKHIKLHPAAVGKARMVLMGVCTKLCHLSPLYSCQLFGVWEKKKGWEGGLAWGVHLFCSPTSAPNCPSALKPASGYQVVRTHPGLHAQTNKHRTTSVPPPLPVIRVSP